MTAALRRTGRGLWWYLREVTGEGQWDAYVERCRRDVVDPMPRRDFERHRAAHREQATGARCC